MLAALAAVCALPAPARAYSTKTAFSDGCHETITFSALRGVRSELSTAAPIAADSEDERALLDDLPFSVPEDMHELAAASVVLGNRNVDLKNHAPDDLEYLAQVHGNPNHQDEHCLRAPDQDDPDGDPAALAACRAYIAGRVQAALEGLAADGMPNPALRSRVEVYLEIRGTAKVSLPTFWWEIGRALHGIQDGFSHTYRSQEDPERVIAVMNYVEFVEHNLNEKVDGPPHSSGMDRCSDLDAFRKQRLQLAVDASADILRATLNPTLDHAGKEVAVDDVLTRYLSYQAGCNAANDWCDAPERKYPEERGCVCSTPGGARGTPAGNWLGLVALGALAAAGARRRGRATTARALWLAAGAGILLAAQPAKAQTELPPPEEPAVPSYELAPDRTRLVEPRARVEQPEKFPLGVSASGGASIANTAAVAALGLRWRFADHFLIGIDGEYNPFYAKSTKEFRGGVMNLYASGILRFPMSFENVNLRSTLSAGISRMNMDLYGVPEGTIGPFVGFNLLGLDFELARQFYLVINPAYVAIPIPQTTGVPYSYPQYRIMLGFQLGA